MPEGIAEGRGGTIITFYGSLEGVGRTTIAINLASALARRNQALAP